MQAAFAIAAIVIGALFVALILGLFTKQPEEVKRTKTNKTQQPKKNEKKNQKKNDKTKKAKKDIDSVLTNTTYDGEDEDEAADLMKFLKGTSELKAKAARKELNKKANEAAKAAAASKAALEAAAKQAVKGKKGKGGKQEVTAATAAVETTEEEFAFVKQRPKKEAKKADAPAEADVPAEADTKGKKKSKTFFKDEAVAEQAARDKRKLGAKGKKGPRSENQEGGAANDNKDRPAGNKDRPRKPRKEFVEGEEASAVEGEEAGEPRVVRERKPREAPPAPPKPLAGAYEASSLDDMLSAMTTFYTNFFSKLPQKALVNIISFLSLKDVATFARVNHQLSKITRGDDVWRALGERDYNLKFDRKTKGKKAKIVYKEAFNGRKGAK